MGEILSRDEISTMAELAAGEARKITFKADVVRGDVDSLGILGVAEDTWRDLARVPKLSEDLVRRSLKNTRGRIKALQLREDALMIVLRERRAVLHLPNGQVVEFPVKSLKVEEERRAKGMIPGPVFATGELQAGSPVPPEDDGWLGRLER